MDTLMLHVKYFMDNYTVNVPVAMAVSALVVGYLVHMFQHKAVAAVAPVVKAVTSPIIAVAKVVASPVVAVVKAVAPAPKATVEDVKKLQASVDALHEHLKSMAVLKSEDKKEESKS